jgi:CheY-like chemotaxis protein
MSSSQGSPSQSRTVRRILFVDGDPLLRAVYAEEARQAGFEPLVAGSGREAWRTFVHEKPDALVTDFDLPGKPSGEELISSVRRTRLGAIIPVVAVSPGIKAIRGPTDAVNAHDVDDYLEKPVHALRLMWRLKELLEGRKIGVVDASGAEVPSEERPVRLDRTTDFLQGKLDRSDPATLFFSYFANGRSGKLLVMRGKEVRQIWFRRGRPVFAESNVSGEEFGQWLVDRGHVEADDLDRVRAEWLKVERPLGTMLVADGAIGARTMFDEAAAHLEAVVDGLFAWSTGNYYLDYEPDITSFQAPDTVTVRLTPAQFVMRGVRRHYSRARCLQLLRPCTGSLAVSDAAHYILRELDDPYYFENLLSQVTQGRPVREVLSGHPFDKDADALAALTALWVLGGVVEQVRVKPVRKTGARNRRADRIREAVATATRRRREHPERKAARAGRVRQRLRPRKAETREKLGSTIMSALDQASGEFAYEKGRRRFQQGDFESSAQALEDALRLGKLPASGMRLLAVSYLRQNKADVQQLTRAAEVLKRAIALEPSQGVSYHWMGTLLARLGHRDEAILTLRRALELGSKYDPETRLLLQSLRGRR